jgi:argininosuccinate lyase
MKRINVSIGFDQKLYAQDIRGSLAHASMLEKTGILTAQESTKIREGLEAIEREIASGAFVFRQELEDIHMNIEARLAELIGEAAGRLHTARSRNDQVALDFRLYVRDAARLIQAQLTELQEALLARAEEHAATLMPGFTHLQAAQPVTFGHHLLAYVEMFRRDKLRLDHLLIGSDECPLGAAALAGTSFPIDRHMTAAALGFGGPMRNSLDAVSDRDFALEFLSVAATSAIHLTRLAEELILWSSPAFGFIALSDLFTSGSSIMPQKRNPDAAELVRGKAGRIVAAQVSLLMTMKSLPLAYNKDMQEDKEPVFEAQEQWMLCLQAMAGMIRDLEVKAARMRDMAEAGYSTATDLADWLVRCLRMPFRRAHHVTAKIVQEAAKRQVPLSALPLEAMQGVEAAITADVYQVLSAERSVESRVSFGGTAPENVRRAVLHFREHCL